MVGISVVFQSIARGAKTQRDYALGARIFDCQRLAMSAD
jgi:hypothetical protein